MSEAGDSFLSTQEIADRFGVSQAIVTRIIDRLDIAARVGRYRIVRESDVHKIETGIRATFHSQRGVPKGKRSTGPAKPQPVGA